MSSSGMMDDSRGFSIFPPPQAYAKQDVSGLEAVEKILFGDNNLVTVNWLGIAFALGLLALRKYHLVRREQYHNTRRPVVCGVGMVHR